MNVSRDDHYMRMALEEARLAASEGEVPVGAVLVHSGEVIARGTTGGSSCKMRCPTPRSRRSPADAKRCIVGVCPDAPCT